MTQTQKSKPDYAVYLVEGEGDKAHWTKIGAACPTMAAKALI